MERIDILKLIVDKSETISFDERSVTSFEVKIKSELLSGSEYNDIISADDVNWIDLDYFEDKITYGSDLFNNSFFFTYRHYAMNVTEDYFKHDAYIFEDHWLATQNKNHNRQKNIVAALAHEKLKRNSSINYHYAKVAEIKTQLEYLDELIKSI